QPTTSPLSAPEVAAARPMTRSDRPCTEGRLTAPTDSVTRVEPPTIVPDHPSPSITRPSDSWGVACPAVPATAQAPSRKATPVRITGRRPHLSVSHPVIGENAYMP